MPRDTGNVLLDFALERVEHLLRTVTVIYEDDSEVIYLREDLEQRYSAQEYESIVDVFRTDMGFDATGPSGAPLGSKESIIHYHEDGFVFQFNHEDCHSILLSVDPEGGSQLQAFITECRKRI